jgi:hypothetical protein
MEPVENTKQSGGGENASVAGAENAATFMSKNDPQQALRI